MTVVGNIVSEILWNRLGIYLGIYIYSGIFNFVG